MVLCPKCEGGLIQANLQNGDCKCLKCGHEFVTKLSKLDGEILTNDIQ